MNNQMPFNFLPPQFNNPTPQGPGPVYDNNQNCHCTGEIRNINEKIENLQKQMRRLERRVTNLENSNVYVTPVPLSNNQNPNNPNGPYYNTNNYMI